MTKPCAFDALIEVPGGWPGGEVRGRLLILGLSVPAVFRPYEFPGEAGTVFVSVTPGREVAVKWDDPFEAQAHDGRPLGRGRVLDPAPPEDAEVKPARKRALLGKLAAGEREMVLALTERKGVQGLGGDDIAAFTRLGRLRVETVARSLEEEGRVRILSFSPLFLVSQDSLDFLKKKVAAYLAAYHKRHPGQRGAPVERLENRFPAPAAVLRLALRTLVKDGTAAMEGGTVWLADFKIPLSEDDERILGELETMFLKGEFGAVTLDEVRERFRLSPGKLQTLMAVLTERKKIVEARDGFLLHSKWLDELIAKVRGSGKRELTVADFKEMTGLSRKYAIPLLELLDEMGVTRRKGAVRDVLK